MNYGKITPLLNLYDGKIILAACKLGIFEKLSNKKMTAKEIAISLNLDFDYTKDFMLLLKKIGVVLQNDQYFYNTEEALTYLNSKSKYFLKNLLLSLSTWGDHWNYIDEAVKFGKSAVELINSSSSNDTWTQLFSNQERVSSFLGAMTEKSKIHSDWIIDNISINDNEVLVDCGGGSGNLLVSLLNKFNISKAILFERIEIIELLKKELNTRFSNIQSRIQLKDGDFFKPSTIPENGTTYILSWILHNWKDADAHLILKNLNERMSETSKLIVFDTVAPFEAISDQTEIVGRFSMKLYFGSSERNYQDFKELFEKSNFIIEKYIQKPSEPTKALFILKKINVK